MADKTRTFEMKTIGLEIEASKILQIQLLQWKFCESVWADLKWAVLDADFLHEYSFFLNYALHSALGEICLLGKENEEVARPNLSTH